MNKEEDAMVKRLMFRIQEIAHKAPAKDFKPLVKKGHALTTLPTREEQIGRLEFNHIMAKPMSYFEQLPALRDDEGFKKAIQEADASEHSVVVVALLSKKPCIIHRWQKMKLAYRRDISVPTGPIDKRCIYCGTKSDEPLRCSRCKRAYYCGAECQKKDWKGHKEACNAVAVGTGK